MTKENEASIVEIISALRICNNKKGQRCSQCPVFGRYGYPRTCKRTIDLKAADMLESFQWDSVNTTRGFRRFTPVIDD